jgi:hypothetical protein
VISSLILATNGFLSPIDPLEVAAMGLESKQAPPIPLNIPTFAPAPQIYQGIQYAGGGGGIFIDFSSMFDRQEERKQLRLAFGDDDFDQCAPPVAMMFRLPLGPEGAQASARGVASASWEARLDEGVHQWAVEAIASCGKKRGERQVAECLMAAVRQQLTFVQDPLWADRLEHPSSVASRLLSGETVGGDCATYVGLLLAAAASVGIQGAAIVQFTEGKWPHLIAALRLNKKWVAFDPSSETLEGGQRTKADSETWFLLGKPNATSQDQCQTYNEAPMFVGVGAPAAAWAPVATAPLGNSAPAVSTASSSRIGWLLAGLLLGALAMYFWYKR